MLKLGTIKIDTYKPFQSFLRSAAAWAIGLLLGWQCLAAAQTVTVQAPPTSLLLPALVPAFNLPLTEPVNPEDIWLANTPTTQPANPGGVWSVGMGLRTAAKFTLSAQKEHIYSIEVPLVRMDRVDIFWRTPGQAWKQAAAGDTIALSQWPVVGQFATFILYFDTLPGQLDVLLLMQNAGAASTSVYLNSDRESRERRLLQANAAGLMIGASLMTLLVIFLLLVVYRNKAAISLLVYCACVSVGAAVLNGYGAIWFFPNWPQANDAGKPLVASLTGACLMWACMSALDKNALLQRWRNLAASLSVICVVYGVLQVDVLHPQWRLLGGMASAVIATLTVWWLAYKAWGRGDIYAQWVALAAGLFALSAALVAVGHLHVSGLDIYTLCMSALLIASTLLLRHVLILRERFGRAVMGRAQENRYRDPLTALLSYEGFEREVDNLAVRQHSGSGAAHMLYFSLSELDSFRTEDGYLVWQRDLVRFAAVLQKSLGEGWHIARLSNKKFGAVRLDDLNAKTNSEKLLTLVLTSCARKIETEGWVDRVGLRMAGVSTPLTSTGLKDSLRTLDQSLRDLAPGKRIALL